MIARSWRGVVQLDDADAYANYIPDTGFTEYAETSGNRGARMLRATRATGPSSSPCRCGRMWMRSGPSPATISRPPSSTPRTNGTSSASPR